MKRIIFFIALPFLAVSSVFAEINSLKINENVTLSTDGKSYLIEYNSTEYVIDTILEKEGKFSCFRFDEKSDFQSTEYPGRPLLPLMSTFLQTPENCNIKLSVENAKYKEIHLPFTYYPYQEIAKNEIPIFRFDTNYYAKQWQEDYLQSVRISDKFHYLGATGTVLTFSPVQYNPDSNKISLLTHALIRIDLDSLGFPVILPYSDFSLGRHLFDSYRLFEEIEEIEEEDKPDPASYKGNYAIITKKENVEALQNFVDYKTSLGYKMNIYTLENDIKSNTATDIRNFLRNLYWNGERPNFVLLVGNVDDIPCSAGTKGKYADPPTDVYYACLEKENIKKEPLTPELLIGRWPITSIGSIKEITDKTIAFEKEVGNMNKSKLRAALFSGTGDGKLRFYKDIKRWGEFLNNAGLQKILYDGRQYSQTEARYYYGREMKDNLWLFGYAGHGNITILGGPLKLETTDLEYYITKNIPPIGFFFACSMNDFISDSYAFGKVWTCMANNIGGVASYGSTTTSFMAPDSYSSRAIFKEFAKSQPPHLGSIINNGMMKYKGDWLTYPDWGSKNNQFKRYALLSDPSLYVYGIDTNREPIYMPKTNNEENIDVKDDTNDSVNVFPTMTDDILIVTLPDETINTRLQIIDLNGRVLIENTLQNSNTEINVQHLPNGIYIVNITGNSINYKNKIIVSH